MPNEIEDHKTTFLENIDVLLAEHKVEEAVEALDIEKRSSLELNGSGNASSTEASSYKPAFLKRKAMLEDQLVEITKQPSVGTVELKEALSFLLKLRKGPLAHQLMLKAYGSHLRKSIKSFLPSCSIYPETYSATLSKLVFSENAPSSETVSALRAASICVQASLSHCSMLESQGLKLSKLLMVLLRPYIEEVLEMNFRRARRMVFDLAENDGTLPLSPRYVSPLSAFATSSDSVLIDYGTKFMFIAKDIVEQLTLVAISHFGGTILTRISQLFDKYVDALIKTLPGPSEDDNLMEHKEVIPFRAETDAQQLALLGSAFTVADELLPMAVSRIWSTPNESKEPGSGATENIVSTVSNTIEFKDWRRHLQHSLDELRDHFCRQYVLNFIYSREGKTRLDARMYLTGKGEHLSWDSGPFPSLPFQVIHFL
ncbi:hypothetical protein HHK36_001418 [Tetracentron sinense]|uniref:Exocyst component Exo84 C-terminal domain-containing protein n=1 Tax=Tetracentron sinense TaxID=13715 RepID=A0A834ZTH1_TETSI|nr:hypothetical protein HHK36_001418 [Tetracentron sinense]